MFSLAHKKLRTSLLVTRTAGFYQGNNVKEIQQETENETKNLANTTMVDSDITVSLTVTITILTVHLVEANLTMIEVIYKSNALHIELVALREKKNTGHGGELNHLEGGGKRSNRRCHL